MIRRFNDYGEPLQTEPEDGFQGHWIPATLCYLVEDGEINEAELYLLATIARFDFARGKGCWASNERLGKLCGGKSERQVRRMLRKLTDHGLVKRIRSNDHERVLVTVINKVQTFHRKKTKTR